MRSGRSPTRATTRCTRCAPTSRVTIAWLQLRAGEWEEAERRRAAELGAGSRPAAARADDPDRARDPPRRRRRRAAARPSWRRRRERTGEIQRIGPALELAAEWSLTTGAPMPTEGFAHLAPRDAAARSPGRLDAAADRRLGRRGGLDVDYDEPMTPAHAAMMRRDWRRAADAYGAAGWYYDRALMLSLLDDEEALAEAVAIARGLGAEPLDPAGHGADARPRIRVPRGPREETRANPAGLTARQLEVLELLGRGAHERGDRRSPGGVAADGRAPRGRGAGEARGDRRAGRPCVAHPSSACWRRPDRAPGGRVGD